VALEHANRQLESANERLGELATTDALTGVSNRRRFDDLLYQEWARHRRRNAPLALILSDIDFFKQFNDLYGHTEGDEALKAVAGAIRASLRRETDVVSRYGGEEFAVLLPDTNHDGAVQLAEQIRRTVGDLGIPHRASTTTGKLSVSLGVAVTIPTGTEDPTALLDAADAALYKAKEQGRDQVVVAE
jgi:diguanylate cyclase (GGDEF)-like protein